ncbi:MAG: hypothetical protein WKG07_00535 [Hymenobacter sp.]
MHAPTLRYHILNPAGRSAGPGRPAAIAAASGPVSQPRPDPAEAARWRFHATVPTQPLTYRQRAPKAFQSSAVVGFEPS